MTQSTDPSITVDSFCNSMSKFAEFKRTEIPERGFDSWEHNGMHDPPKSGRLYAKVLRRINFEAGFTQNGFVVQVDLLGVPGDEMLPAVFVRSKDYPKGKNTANATFKFRWDTASSAYFVDFKAKDVILALQNPQKVPSYINCAAQRSGRVLIGSCLDQHLIHNLLLLADFAAQTAAGANRSRDPAKFYAPIKDTP